MMRLIRGMIFLAALAMCGLPAIAEAQPWSELTAMQKEALAPLSDTWGTLDDGERDHFLKLASHYPSLAPEKKVRMQENLVKWSKLTPEQRKSARKNYRAFSQIPEHQRKEVRKMVREQQQQEIASGVNSAASRQ